MSPVSPAGPAGNDAPPPVTRHTSIAIGLNVVLLAMIAYGYEQSEDYRWAWALVAVPIVVVTATYVKHWFRG